MVFFRLDGEEKTGSLPKQCKQQCQDDADNDAGGDGKIEAEFFLSNDDIPGESSNPRDFLTHQQKETDEDDENAQKNK
jgi:hypothetical protein